MRRAAGRHRLSRGFRLAGTALCCLGVPAAGAAAATLRIKTPSRVHTGQVYEITTTGTFKRKELTGTAFFLAFIQPNWSRCQRTAQLEKGFPSFVLYFHGLEKHSPFTQTNAFKAQGTGERRVCAYLYGKYIRPRDATTPIATATARYQTTNA